MAAKPITRIIRFRSDDGKIYFGEEPAAGVSEAVVLSGGLFDGTLARTAASKPVTQLLAPLEPCNIFCIGLNYMRHYEESAKKRGIPLPDKPVIFMKPTSALSHPGDTIQMPRIEKGEQLDWEVELTIVVGRACRDVRKEDALKYVHSYTVGNDVSSRHWQKNAGAGQWVKGKSFDGFSPLGPVLVTTEAIPDPQKLRVITRVNGETQQDSDTADMIFTCAECIEWLSHNMTLLPGSIVMTGTGCGIGAGRSPPVFLKKGDVLETEIPGIGLLRNRITAPPTDEQAIAGLLADMSERRGCATSPW